jgi:23S rRNA pseudouridine1911/1915/1917 synthase
VTEARQSFRVSREDDGRRLLDVLAAELRCSKKSAKDLLDRRRVFVERRRTWMAKHAVRAGELIEIAPEAGPVSAAGAVLYEDDHCLVIDKPAGRPTQGRGSVEEIWQRARPGIRAVHRLDRDTSGCLLFAKTDRMREHLIEAFRAGRVVKIYRAVCNGRFPTDLTKIETPIDGQRAVTRCQRLKAGHSVSLLRLRLDTGRTHQIRKHLASVRHPLVGDKEYGKKEIESAQKRGIGRQLLHAAVLAFPGLDGKEIRCNADDPPDFERARRELLHDD